jgi:hypothetical protein
MFPLAGVALVFATSAVVEPPPLATKPVDVLRLKANQKAHTTPSAVVISVFK